MFRENNVDYEKVNYFIEPLPEEKLRELLKKADLQPSQVLRKNDPAFKEMNLPPDASEDEIIRAMVENPNLLQRPIVEIGERAVLARPVEKVYEILNL